VSDPTTERAVAPSVGTAWAGRGVAVLCATAGLYAAAVAAIHVAHGESLSIWILPLSAGGLAALVGAVVACERQGEVIAWRVVARRAGAMALLAAYAFALLPLLGFLTGSILIALAVAVLYAENRVLVAAGGLVIAIGMWALFAYTLAEPLPGGLWWR
jgi:hypothetical protein